MNKKQILLIVLVIAVMLLAGCSPDKKGAEGDAESVPQEQVAEPQEELPTEGEETPANDETELTEDEEPQLLEDGGDLMVVVPDDQEIGGI